MSDAIKQQLEKAVNDYNRIMSELDTKQGEIGHRSMLVSLGIIDLAYKDALKAGMVVSIIDIDEYTKQVQYGGI